jgi:hypothetical protein
MGNSSGDENPDYRLKSAVLRPFLRHAFVTQTPVLFVRVLAK